MFDHLIMINCVLVKMLQDDPSEDSGNPEPDSSPAFQCPDCLQTFKRKHSLERHISYTCKKIPQPDILSSPRVPIPPKVCVSKLTVDAELDTLLATVDSDYARWRLSQVLGVPQSTTFPILFCYRFNNSKLSALSNVCPTSDPYTTLYNVLIDAKLNFQVEQISIDKNVTIVHSDGSEENVSKWLKPTRVNPRTNRPVFNVEETEATLIYSLDNPGTEPDLEDSILEDSLQKMSLGHLDANTSISSAFTPR